MQGYVEQKAMPPQTGLGRRSNRESLDQRGGLVEPAPGLEQTGQRRTALGITVRSQTLQR